MKKHACPSVIKIALLSTVLAIASSNASATGSPRIGAGVSIGSLGAGATIAFGINRSLEARIGFNQFSMDFDIDAQDLNYIGDVSLSTTTAILDFYPSQRSGFRLSLGAFLNNNEINGTASPGDPVTLGSQVFQPEDIGSASASVAFPDTAPYVGLGWGRRTGEKNSLRFSVDAGVFMQGQPTTTLSIENPNGIISDEDIEQARTELQETLDDFELYPVLTLGVGYSF